MKRRRQAHRLSTRTITRFARTLPGSVSALPGVALALATGGLGLVAGTGVILLADWIMGALKVSFATIVLFSMMAFAGLFIVLLAAVVLVSITWNRHDLKMRDARDRAIGLSDVDSMPGMEFERYLQRILRSRGYDVSSTRATGDLGVDLVAAKDNERIAIQIKRYSGTVSRHAISDAVAGMRPYGCNRAMVVTNSYFGPGAVTLARSNGCILVDRRVLVQWMMDYQKATHNTFADSERTEQ